MSLSIRARAFALACAAAAAAATGAEQPPASSDPASASAPVPPLIYKPLLAGRRPLGNDAPTPWRQANEQAASIGGWRAYAREAQQPDPPAAAASGAIPPAGRRAP